MQEEAALVEGMGAFGDVHYATGMQDPKCGVFTPMGNAGIVQVGGVWLQYVGDLGYV